MLICFSKPRSLQLQLHYPLQQKIGYGDYYVYFRHRISERREQNGHTDYLTDDLD